MFSSEKDIEIVELNRRGPSPRDRTCAGRRTQFAIDRRRDDQPAVVIGVVTEQFDSPGAEAITVGAPAKPLGERGHRQLESVFGRCRHCSLGVFTVNQCRMR